MSYMAWRFLYSTKESLKRIDFFRDNYRRTRKIVLHIKSSRFYPAFIVGDHYNPLYRLGRGKYHHYRRQRNNLAKVLASFYRYDLTHPKSSQYNVGLVFRDGCTFPKSSAFIRLISPLTAKSVNKQIGMRIIPAEKPKTKSEIGFYVVQRTAFDNLKQAKRFVGKVKKNRAKLIVDNDDAFNLIPSSHPEYHMHLGRINAMNYLMDQADQIWVSTSILIHPRYRDKSVVVRNSLDKKLWQSRGKIAFGNLNPTLEMVYMGTATHNDDFKMILPALDKVYENFPGTFRLTVIGVSSSMAEREWIRRVRPPRYGSLYPTFVGWFLQQEPFDIGLSPLVDSEFNRAKSDIKCLDYLAAGILPVVSNIRPYQAEEIENFIIKIDNNLDSWVAQLSKIASDSGQFREKKKNIIAKAQVYLWEKRNSQQTGKILLGLLEDLASKP
jgi:hypothetical protein